MSVTTRCLIWLIVLAVIDTAIPIPITAVVMIFVVVRRPRWFRDMVSDIYSRAS